MTTLAPAGFVHVPPVPLKIWTFGTESEFVWLITSHPPSSMCESVAPGTNVYLTFSNAVVPLW
jgi:hypothetical protein